MKRKEFMINLMKYGIIISLSLAMGIQVGMLSINQPRQTKCGIPYSDFNHGVRSQYITVWYTNFSAKYKLGIEVIGLNLSSVYLLNITENNHTDMLVYQYSVFQTTTKDKYLEYRLSSTFANTTNLKIELWLGDWEITGIGVIEGERFDSILLDFFLFEFKGDN